MNTDSPVITVAHLIPGVPYGGGAERLLLDICRAMDKQRFRVVVFYWTDEGGLSPELAAEGVLVVRLYWDKVLSLLSIRSLCSMISRYGVKVLHTHFIDADLLGAAAGFFLKVPVVAHVHSFPFPQNARQALRYRLMAPFLARVIAVSDCVKECLWRQSRVGGKKCVVMPNGVDVARFIISPEPLAQESLRRFWGIDPGCKVIGTVTRFEKDKSVDTLIRSVPLLKRVYPNIKCLIVGFGFEEDSLKRLSDELGVASSIIFVGRQKDVPLYLSIMDVFVLPAVEEAFGLSLLEAMAAGRAVVAANAAALPDLLKDGAGLLFKPRDAESLASAVLRLLNDPALASRLASAASVRAKGYSMASLVCRLEQLYHEVLL